MNVLTFKHSFNLLPVQIIKHCSYFICIAKIIILFGCISVYLHSISTGFWFLSQFLAQFSFCLSLCQVHTLWLKIWFKIKVKISIMVYMCMYFMPFMHKVSGPMMCSMGLSKTVHPFPCCIYFYTKKTCFLLHFRVWNTYTLTRVTKFGFIRYKTG